MQTSRSKQVVADDVLPAVICYITGRRQIYIFPFDSRTPVSTLQ